MLFINIHLNKLQIRIKQRLQNSKHYKKIRRIKKRIYRILKQQETATENRNSFRQIRKKRD